MNHQITPEILNDKILEFVEELKMKNILQKGVSDAYSHFNNWLKFNKDGKGAKGNNTEDVRGKIARNVASFAAQDAGDKN